MPSDFDRLRDQKRKTLAKRERGEARTGGKIRNAPTYSPEVEARVDAREPTPYTPKRSSGPKYDLGGGIKTDNAQDVVDIFIGGDRGIEAQARLQGTGPGDYDLSRYREGDLSDRQVAELFVYQAPRNAGRWQADDGTWNNSLLYRAQQMDAAMQAAIAIQPELANEPQVLWAIANEPFLAQRLRGMAKARDFLDVRADAIRLGFMPEEHQTAWWENLDVRQKEAYRKAGYTPPAEMPQVEQSGLGGAIGDAIGKLGTVAEYTGLDVPLGAVPWTMDKAFRGLGAIGNEVGTLYRAAHYAADTRSLDDWWSTYNRARDGDRFFDAGSMAEAQAIANGNSTNLDLYVRLAAGESFEEILEDFAEPGSTQYQEGYQFLSEFVADRRTQRAVQTLQRGHITFGQDVAELTGFEPGSALHTLISGSFDGAFVVLLDPTLAMGKAAHASRALRWGLKAGDETQQIGRLTRLMGVMDGRQLSDIVTAARGAAPVDVRSLSYWSDLNRMGLSPSQRPMVALADHLQAARTGDLTAAAQFAEAFPPARRMLFTFNRYLDNAIPTLPDGAPVRAVTVGDVVEFYKTPPRAVTVDDVMDYDRDASGLAALLEGQWSSFRHDRIMMPTLSRLGARRIQAKLAMSKAMNWAEDGILRLEGRLDPEDWDSPAAAMSALADSMKTTALSGLDDKLHHISQSLADAGYDGETILRSLNREVVAAAKLEMLPGELPHEAIVRSIVTAFDATEAEKIRGLWRTGLSVHLGDDAARHVDEVEATYRRALGLTGDVDDLVDRSMTLDRAVDAAALAPTDAATARQRGLYEQSLRNTGKEDWEVADALNAFDVMVGERKAAAAGRPVSTTDPDLQTNLGRMLALPLAKTLYSPVRFVQTLARQVPKESFLALDGRDTPIVLEQLLNFGIRGSRARELFGQFLLEGEAGRRLVVRNVYRTMFDRMGILDDPDYADFVQSWLLSTDQRYGIDDLLETRLGAFHVGHLPDAHATSAIALPRFREIDAQVKRGRLLQLLNGHGNKVLGINSAAADTFMSVWRTSVVLRPAMIPRAGGEEMLAQYARWGPSHLFKQQVVGRMLKVDPTTRSRVPALNDALHTTALEATLGIPERPVRNMIQHLSERISDEVSTLAGRLLTPAERHAHRMLATSRTVQRGFSEINGVNAGLAAVAHSDPNQPGRFVLEVIDAKTGDPVLMRFRGAGGWDEVDLTDPFYRQHLSMRWAEHSADEAGRAAVAWLQLDYTPEQARRTAALLRQEVGGTHDLVPDAQVLNDFRAGLAAVPTPKREAIVDWLETHRDQPFPTELLDDEVMAAIGGELSVGAREALTPEGLARVLDGLDWNDANGLLAMSPDLGGLPVAYLGLLADQPMYRGAALQASDNDLLFHEGATWNDVQDLVTTAGHSGPGVYATTAGPYAEWFVQPRGGAVSQPKITRLRWRSGEPPKLINGDDFDEYHALEAQSNELLAEYLEDGLDAETAAVLRHALDERMGAESADEVADIAREVGLDDERAERLADIALSTEWNDVLVAASEYSNRSVIRRLDLRLQSADVIKARLGVADADYRAAYKRLYGKHIVDPMTRKGYRGVLDHQAAPDHQPMALWHSGDLEVVDEIPYAESMLHRIASEQVRQRRARLRLAVDSGDPTARRSALRMNAIRQVRQVLTRPDRQHKLRRLDRMREGVAQGPAKGMIRLHLPVIPDDVMRRFITKARTSPLDNEALDLGTITGSAPAIERAGMLGDVSDPVLREFLDDLVTRLDAQGPQPQLLLNARLATSDPMVADDLLKRLRATVGEEDAELVHLGYVDVTTAEYRALADAGTRHGSMDPDEILAHARRERSDPLEYVEAGTPLHDVVRPNAADELLGTGPVSALSNRPVVGGMAGKWIDNDFILDRAVSMPTNQPVIVATGLTDASRGKVMAALDDLRADDAAFRDSVGLAAQRQTRGRHLRTEGIPAIAPRNDQDMLFELRALVEDGMPALDDGQWDQLAMLLLGSDDDVVRVGFQMGVVQDTPNRRALLDQLARGDSGAVEPITAATLDALEALPRDALAYVLEARAARVPGLLEKADLPATRWAMAEGRSWGDAVDELAEVIVRNAEALVYGEADNVLHGVARAVGEGKYSYAKHVEARDLGPLPRTVMGPQLSEVKEVQGLRKMADRGMEIIGRGISSMARTPIYRKTFADALDDAYSVLRAVMVRPETRARAAAQVDNLDEAADLLYETAAAVDAAEHGRHMTDMDVLETLMEAGLYKPADNVASWIIDKGGHVKRITNRTALSKEEEAILTWWRAERAMRDEAVQIASVRAVDATIPFIDDHRVRSQFAEKIRNVVPFWFAEEQFYKRWVRTFVHSPEAFRRLTLAHNAFRSAGWIEENEYGEEVFMYPGAQYVGKALAGFMELLPMDSKYTLPITPMLQGQLAYAAPGFDRIAVPSAGPIAALPLRVLRSVMPEVALPLEKAILGPRGVGRSVPEMVMPSALYRLMNFLTADDADMAGAVIGAIQMLEANHPEFVPTADASPEEVDAYLERVRNHARVMTLTRAIMGTSLPASPGIDYDPENLSDEFVGYLAAGVPMEEAVANFLRDHPDATPYTIFGTETPSKAPVDPTEAVYEELLDNGDFYEDHRAAGPWLLPPGAPDDPFDRQAWHEMLAHKIRTRKGDLDFYKDLKYAEAAELYYDSQREKDQALATARTASDRKAIKDSWRAWSTDYKAQHRIFAEQMSGQTSQDRRRAVLADLRSALDDERAPEVAHADDLRELLDSFDEYQAERARYANDNREWADRYKRTLRESFIDWAEDFANADPTALLFWRRILLPEVDPGRGYSAELEGENDEDEAA